MTSSSSLLSPSQGKAFWLGAAAGAAVGCCATAALFAAVSPRSSSSSSRSSSSSSRSSSSSSSRSGSSSSRSGSSSSGSRSSGSSSSSSSGSRWRSSSSSGEKGVAMIPCAWLRQLVWWKEEDQLHLHSSEEEKEKEEESRRTAAAGGGGGIRAADAFAAEGPAGDLSVAATAAAGEVAATAAAGEVATAAGEVAAGAGERETQGTGAAGNDVFDAAAAEERGEACPGPDSEKAGAAAACAGCPNRGICSSGSSSSSNKESVKSMKEEIAAKLAAIKKKVLILSGKGGVGKSTITAQLGWTASSRGLRVGVLDIDVCGPSIPLMMHVRQGEVHQSAEGWQPVYVHDNLAVMSIGFLLPDPDAAVVWRGPKKNGLIQQFLADVLWGDLDLLLIDTPPGTSDEHLSIVSLLNVDGALVVTTPQEAALQDVRKELNFCTKVGVKVLGVVENMANSVFSLVDVDGAKKMCKQMKVPYAGSVPLDASLLRACEEGVAAVEEYAQQPGSQALQKLMTDLLEMLGLPQNREEEEDD